MSGGGSSVDLDVITAGAGDILAGKTGIDPEGDPLPGTMTDRTNMGKIAGDKQQPSYYARSCRDVSAGKRCHKWKSVSGNLPSAWILPRRRRRL